MYKYISVNLLNNNIPVICLIMLLCCYPIIMNVPNAHTYDGKFKEAIAFNVNSWSLGDSKVKKELVAPPGGISCYCLL